MASFRAVCQAASRALLDLRTPFLVVMTASLTPRSGLVASCLPTLLWSVPKEGQLNAEMNVFRLSIVVNISTASPSSNSSCPAASSNGRLRTELEPLNQSWTSHVACQLTCIVHR